ncbi:MAG TPA: GFA family protein, partial [Candidatus Limnocylindrales bacterium]
MSPPTRRAACSCGQLSLEIEGEPVRISMCHCFECQRRTGAVLSNQARFPRERVSVSGTSTAWTRTAE